MSIILQNPALASFDNVSTIFPGELGDVEDSLSALPGSAFRIGLLIPMCGSAGLWAPSCISSAQVAVAQLNKMNGICGRPVELIMIDSALEAPTPVEEVINSLIQIRAIDAIVGMHISAVRQTLSKIVNQRVPYIYTPLYEGGENTKGIFAIGETPDQQLGPALEYLQDTHKIKSWALIGNDYVWPRASNSYAKSKLNDMSVHIAYEKYVPFGLNDMTGIVEEIGRTDAEAVLISLVGQDAITFNRAFGYADMHQKMIRLSCAIEENGLLATGAENLQGLYSASSYFGSLATDANAAFKEKYHSFHGDSAPVLNAIGQSTYEGVQFLAGLMKAHEHDWESKNSSCLNSIKYSSVRLNSGTNAVAGKAPMYLALADGVMFNIIKTI
ncbi:MAG: substrate-binding domain-containing protein [Cohaesibacteraceae bacterium]|nr:substrate-binding domain-containing protein [Cohaesibacteraceae bacterium]